MSIVGSSFRFILLHKFLNCIAVNVCCVFQVFENMISRQNSYKTRFSYKQFLYKRSLKDSNFTQYIGNSHNTYRTRFSYEQFLYKRSLKDSNFTQYIGNSHNTYRTRFSYQFLYK